MPDGFLRSARRHAESAEPSVRAAALLWIARAESSQDRPGARDTLLAALDHVRQVASPNREYLLDEARFVAAAVSPDLIAGFPIRDSYQPAHFVSGRVVLTMVQHGHLDAACDYLLHYDDNASFPCGFVANVLHELDLQDTETAARSANLLRRAAETWRGSALDNHFVRLFGYHWTKLPREEATEIVHEIVARALKQVDIATSAGYMNEFRFTSSGQNQMFEILHVLRHLDPALAQSLVESHNQLAVAALRFPNGIETINEEAAAEAERRKAAGAVCGGGGYILTGHAADFDRRRPIIDDVLRGDFASSVAYALDKYQEDTASDRPNHAPKAFWPSTGEFRSTLYQAGKRLGPAAASLLDQTPDPDLRLFATIELAAALAGLPPPTITSRRQAHPGGRRRRVIGSHPLQRNSNGETLRSTDGRLVRCPNCLFRPPGDFRWQCKCGHRWNTFWTGGRCPACQFQWVETGCPACGRMWPHKAWYLNES